MPRRGISPDTVAKAALRTLEESALQNIDDFGSQEIANTLHIMAKQRHYKPIENLLLALEGRAEAISGEFDSQHIANTLIGKRSGHPSSDSLSPKEAQALFLFPNRLKEARARPPFYYPQPYSPFHAIRELHEMHDF